MVGEEVLRYPFVACLKGDKTNNLNCTFFEGGESIDLTAPFKMH